MGVDETRHYNRIRKTLVPRLGIKGNQILGAAHGHDPAILYRNCAAGHRIISSGGNKPVGLNNQHR